MRARLAANQASCAAASVVGFGSPAKACTAVCNSFSDADSASWPGRISPVVMFSSMARRSKPSPVAAGAPAVDAVVAGGVPLIPPLQAADSSSIMANTNTPGAFTSFFLLHSLRIQKAQ